MVNNSGIPELRYQVDLAPSRSGPEVDSALL